MKLISADRLVSGDGTIGDSVLVDDGVIAAVGFRDDLSTDGSILQAHHTGMSLVAGFRDAHMHPVPYAALLQGCSLKQAQDMEDLGRRLVAYASTLRPDDAIVATRLDDESLAENRLPTRLDLDDAIPDRPVVIYRYCGHVAVANTVALERSGITAATPDPEGGTIDRGADGSPSGVLRETAAGLISSALARGGTLDEETLLDAMRRLAGLGITSIGAMIGYGERPFEHLEAEIDLWLRVADRLPIRVHCFAIAGSPKDLSIAARRLRSASPRLQWAGVKRFSDGSFGGHTAALTSPYADAPGTGTYRLTEADVDVSRESVLLGGSVAIHAIGDQAIDGVLDVFNRLAIDAGAGTVLRMEHVSLIRPDQIERFSASGVTAVIQPAFLASESEWVEGRVGPQRSGWLYPFRSLIEAGIPVAGSSDCPVEPPHPLWGMSAAMSRHGVNEDEQLTGLQALRTFTTGGAASLREPTPLAIGSPADLVVIDTDPNTASAEEVRRARIIETYVDGVAVEVDRSLPTWPDLG